MKKVRLIYFCLIFLLSISCLFATALISYFQVLSDDGIIKLRWQTQSEDNVKEFVIYRKSVGAQYVELDRVSAKGSLNRITEYEYKDLSAYKTEGTVYKYKLVFIDNNGSKDGESSEVTVSHSVSSVKRTWGSIKALFR